MRIGVQVVAVVPTDHQPEVAHRSEHRRASPDHRTHLPARNAQPRGVPGPGAEVGAQDLMLAGAHDSAERCINPRDITVVGHHDQRPAPG